MKNILSSLNEFEKRRILEMHYKASNRNYLIEQPITSIGTPKQPEDPSQKSVTITTELTAVDSAIASFVAEYNKKYLAGMIDARDLGKEYKERITPKPKKDSSGKWTNLKPLKMWFQKTENGGPSSERIFGLYTNCKTDTPETKVIGKYDNYFYPFIQYEVLGSHKIYKAGSSITRVGNSDAAGFAKEILDYTEAYGNKGKNGECVDSSIDLSSAANTLGSAISAMFTKVYTDYYNNAIALGAKVGLSKEDISYNFGSLLRAFERDGDKFIIYFIDDWSKIKPKA